MNRIALTQCLVVCGMMLVSLGTVKVFAGTGSVISLPVAGKRAKSGLLVKIDTHWLDGNGYRPVRVRVSPIPAGPAPADRSIRVTLSPRDWQARTKRATVTATIELAQGDRFSQETIAVPQHEEWSSIDVEVREDGVELKDLSQKRLNIPRRSPNAWSEAVPTILFIDSDVPTWPVNASQRRMPSPPAGVNATNTLPDIRSIASRLPTGSGYAEDRSSDDPSKAIEDREILRILRDLPRLEMVPPADLPDRWINLTGVDITFISKRDLELLSSKFPQKWEALRAWLATGTVLCVTGTTIEEAALAELESILAVRPLAKSDRELRGWAIPDKKNYADRIFALKSHYPNSIYARPFGNSSFQLQQSKTEKEEEAPAQEPPQARPFVWRGVGSGQLVAISDQQHFVSDPQTWCWLLNSLSAQKWMWYRRHGFSMYRENADYWKLLIPNVGEAPVNSFLLLISLFVVVIGPINYFLLQRSGRLYLLPVTVPAGAILITLGLLAYALLTDGLSVRARARSVTEIDQNSGRAVAWSRQTYYAGMAPAGGIAFPVDAAVYPVEFRPRNRFIQTDRRWHTVWGTEQRLAAGFLPSRTTTQFLVVESRPTKAGLDIEMNDDGSLGVTNRLGSELLRLLIRDDSGAYHEGHRLSASGSAVLQKVKPDEVSEPWNVWFTQNMPRYPQGFDPFQMENAAEIFPISRASGSGVDSSLPKPTFDSSLFESRLARLRQDFHNLEPRTYLAIVKSSPEVSLGTEQADEQASVHTVLGRW